MRYGRFHIEIKPSPGQFTQVPSRPDGYDFWVFDGEDRDAIHHGAGYPTRPHAFNAAKEWADDHEKRGFK
jgi:hypothetical protein